MSDVRTKTTEYSVTHRGIMDNHCRSDVISEMVHHHQSEGPNVKTADRPPTSRLLSRQASNSSTDTELVITGQGRV